MAYIIAEIGTNHHGDPDLCRSLIQAAIDCDVDAVKMQLFEADTLVRKDAPAMPHTGKKSAWERMKSLELPWDSYLWASEMAHAAGKDFIVSAFSPELVWKVAPLVDKLKVASGDLDYTPVLEAVLSAAKPSILSVGMATMTEAYNAVCELEPWAVLHCTSLYPCPDESVGLAGIPRILRQFPQCEPGYSCHAVGSLACLGAVVMGATVIEKHFTLDNYLPYGDHPHSLDPEDMSAMVKDIRRLEQMMPFCDLDDWDMRQYLRRGKDGLRGSL